MTRNTRIFNRFAYHAEDLDCSCCLHKNRKNKHGKTACAYDVCPYEDIRQDAATHGRIKRKRGHFKCRV
jgi:hypothetical protein